MDDEVSPTNLSQKVDGASRKARRWSLGNMTTNGGPYHTHLVISISPTALSAG